MSTLDAENPEIPINTTKSTKLNLWPNRSPIDSLMLTSSIANTILTCMFTYSATGNLRLSCILSTVAIPCSIVATIIDSKPDYDNWVATKRYRDKGMPEQFMPYKVKYDWAEFHERISQEKKQTAEFSGTKKD